MKVAEKFAGLNGTVASREEIASVIAQAKKENNPDIIYRLSKVLNNNPEEQEFKITVIQFPEKGLNGARHKGSYKEALDDCGRLNPGWKFEYGSVVRVTKKPARAISCKRVAPPKVEKVVAQKEKTKPVSKIDNSKNKAIVGYMLLDSLTTEVIASKKELSDLKKIFEELEHKESFSTLDVFVYEIIKKSGKNVQGNRVIVDWQSEKKAEAKSKATVLAKDEKTKISDPVKTKTTVPKKESKDYSNNNKKASEQLALFGAEVKGLKCAKPVIAEEYSPVTVQKPATQSKYSTAFERDNDTSAPKELYKLKGDLSKFLGKIEIKPVQSLVITLDSAEGGGKTHTFYQWADDFREAGYSVIIWSLEEHKSSQLSIDKAKKYFKGDNIKTIVIESENDGETAEQTWARIQNSVNDFDVCLIDSWAKVLEINPKANVDQDFRKKFNSKLFGIILQRTVSGEIRGGSKAGFDGDVICKAEVDRNDFRNNYIYNHKNRYNDYTPMGELRYSPANRALFPIANKNEIEDNTPNKVEPLKLSYSFTEN